jgi:SAM-dependent methyltransferase
MRTWPHLVGFSSDFFGIALRPRGFSTCVLKKGSASMSSSHICPVRHAFWFDLPLRRFFHNPDRLLAPVVRPGMRVADIGCGPGYFSLALARLVGEQGRVYCHDLQPEMLAMVQDKVAQTPLADRISLIPCQPDRLGLAPGLDLVLAFFMVHEAPDPGRLLCEVIDALKPGGLFILAEPYFHVSGGRFCQTVNLAQEGGLMVQGRPRILDGRCVLLQRPHAHGE